MKWFRRFRTPVRSRTEFRGLKVHCINPQCFGGGTNVATERSDRYALLAGRGCVTRLSLCVTARANGEHLPESGGSRQGGRMKTRHSLAVVMGASTALSLIA